jgi:hypothetical protein
MGILRLVFLVLLLAIPGLSLAQVTTVFVLPQNPTSSDIVRVSAQYAFGPFVSTKSHTVSGSAVFVRFVQDGIDFLPNPPHGATEVIGQLPPGEYTFTVSLEHPGFPTSTRVFTVFVQDTSIPTLGQLGLMLLVALLLLSVVAGGYLTTGSGRSS